MKLLSLVASLLLLLYETSGGEEAEELVSSDYQRASLEFRLSIAPTSHTGDLVAAIDAELEREPLEATTASLTGIGALWLVLLDYIVSSQVTGFLLAFGVIALMMVMVFRSFSVGIISMIPNLTPIAFTLGLMGAVGIYLDYSKVAIAAVAVKEKVIPLEQRAERRGADHVRRRGLPGLCRCRACSHAARARRIPAHGGSRRPS
jgi:predicted RND superfamily exporter protein